MNKLKTFSTEEVQNMVEGVLECMESKTPFYVLPGFITSYMLVYGTLRALGGNWKHHLRNNSEHISTTKMVGFCKNPSISCKFTGSETDYTVMDLFEVHEDKTKSVNSSIDSLEGSPHWYRPILVPIELESGRTVLAKFYEMEWNCDEARISHDYALPMYESDNFATLKVMFPEAWKFYHPTEIAEVEVKEEAKEIILSTETID